MRCKGLGPACHLRPSPDIFRNARLCWPAKHAARPDRDPLQSFQGKRERLLRTWQRSLTTWHQNSTAFEGAGMDGLEHLIDFAERMFLHERRHLDASIHHQLERFGIKFGRTAPVTECAGVEGHQVRQPYFHLVHSKADYCESRAAIEQAERRLLTDLRAGAFENNPFGLAQAVLFGETLDGRPEIARR